jgi:integrase
MPGHVWKPNPNCKNFFMKYKGTDGRWYTESTGTDNKTEAGKQLRAKLAAIDRGEQVTPALAKFSFENAAKDLLNDYANNARRSLSMVERYVRKHLAPFFGGKRMSAITPTDIRAYIAERKAKIIVVKKAHTITHADGRKEDIPAVTKSTSNSEINRELTTLKRMFSLALEGSKLIQKPHIAMLTEAPPRAGFLSVEQFAAIKNRLPSHVQGVAEFGYLTGWRIASEVIPLRWAQVDFTGGTVRLEPGMSKTGAARTFPLTRDLRVLLDAQRAMTDEAQRTLGKVIPLVFHQDGAPISRFDKAWKAAATAAGYPWTIPHDLRRCGVRNLVRAGVPERVAMQMTGHKTRSIFERYNIVSEGDYSDAVRHIDGGAASRASAAKLRRA